MNKNFLIFVFIILSATLFGCNKVEGNMYYEPEESTAVSSKLPGETGDETEIEEPYVHHPLLAEMTLEEKVGQIFLARCPVLWAENDVKKYHLGGYILFGRDFKDGTPESVQNDIEGYQKAAEIPLLIAVDEEGGEVSRVSKYGNFRENEFLSPRSLFKIGGMERLKNDEAEKSLLLKSLGINVNMAPVCDITTDPNAYMYHRSLGQDKYITGEFVSYVVNTNSQNGLGSVLKHFPGYGNNVDTHTGIAVDGRAVSVFEENDLYPFKVGIENKCTAVLFSHTIVKCFDKENPVSLSINAHRYIREKMSFQGVIITDDLDMDAITDVYGVGEAAVLAVLAGNDMICSTDYAKQYNAVLKAVKEGRIPLELLNIAVSRVLYWKSEIGILK